MKQILLLRKWISLYEAMSSSGLVVTGASSFMSKYLERQFNVPPSNSSFLIGKSNRKSCTCSSTEKKMLYKSVKSQLYLLGRAFIFSFPSNFVFCCIYHS